MRVTVLSSGSGGNCTLVEGAGVRVLVDAGLPLRVVRARCAAVGLSLDGAGLGCPSSRGPGAKVSELLITHEHSDHGGAAGVLGRKLGLRVRATRGTLEALRDPPPQAQWSVVRAGEPVLLGEAAAGDASAGQGAAPGAPLGLIPGVIALRPPAPQPPEPQLWVTPIALPHDAAEPVAYRFEERTPQGSVHAAIVTDLGHVPPPLVRALAGLDLLVIEFNHDLRMLLEGPYPWPLKQRIRGGRGHLSNDQAAELLLALCHPGLKQVVLAHLSEHNNTPKRARAAAEDALARGRSGAMLRIGSVKHPLPPLFVEPGPAVKPRWRPAQLALL